MKALKVPGVQIGDRQQAKISFLKAPETLHNLREHAPKHREEYLEDMADIYELKGQVNRVAIVWSIVWVEELRRTYGHIRYSINKVDMGDITQIQYPTHQGWKITTDTRDLEERISTQQGQHFAQANSTPVAKYFKNKSQVQHQRFDLFQASEVPDTTMGLKAWFDRTDPKEISYKIMPSEFQSGIKKWKEHMSTSLLGSHLGHYHAQSLPNMGKEQGDWTGIFIWIHSTIVNLVIDHGVVLTRWTRVHTLLQPKDRGIPKIHRLRPLNLYEVDINLVLRVVLARRLLKHAEQTRKMVDEAWGSRKRRAAGDLGLKKLLMYELSALTRTTLGQIDLDAKSCYDHMTREVAIQTCYVFGTPVVFCLWIYALLQRHQHYVILQSGKSMRPYGHQPEQPHHGIGQGSTAAPVVWLLISFLMFQSMRGWAQEIRWESLDGKMTTHQVADVYVDDATLWVNHIHPPKQLVQQMETDLNRYQEMLRWWCIDTA